jgi:hypothetical protein
VITGAAFCVQATGRILSGFLCPGCAHRFFFAASRLTE